MLETWSKISLIKLSNSFYKHVVRGESVDDCWKWAASKNPQGYGIITVNISKKTKKTLRAHRVSYELQVGPVPNNLHVLHRCDNPECCNTKHLFLGTALDNMKDKYSKGRERHSVGENHGGAKLTEEAAKVIYSQKFNGNVRAITLKYCISRTAVYEIWNRVTWGHVNHA